MGFLFSRPASSGEKPSQTLTPTKALPLVLPRATYIGQPLADVLSDLNFRGIENITVALKPRDRDTWTPPPRRLTGRVIVIYDGDSLLVQSVIYE